MIPKQRRKLLATGFCFAMFLLLACNGTNNGQQKTSDSTTSTNHPHTDTLLSDNEVKAEAPDANIKTEQGYALPRHSANLAQSPINIISGKAEPSGLLPFQMPLSMEEVEKQNEDQPRDMLPYKDALGNVYDFSYGLNWKGVINDARTAKYKK